MLCLQSVATCTSYRWTSILVALLLLRRLGRVGVIGAATVIQYSFIIQDKLLCHHCQIIRLLLHTRKRPFHTIVATRCGYSFGNETWRRRFGAQWWLKWGSMRTRLVGTCRRHWQGIGRLTWSCCISPFVTWRKRSSTGTSLDKQRLRNRDTPNFGRRLLLLYWSWLLLLSLRTRWFHVLFYERVLMMMLLVASLSWYIKWNSSDVYIIYTYALVSEESEEEASMNDYRVVELIKEEKEKKGRTKWESKRKKKKEWERECKVHALLS